MGSLATLAPVASHKVFVYGSLMADEVVYVLLKRVPPSTPAVLHNYHRYRTKGRDYPAILPVDMKQVTGRVMFGITDMELDILDVFEDVEYERENVQPFVLGSDEILQAYAYVWGNKKDTNLYGDWHFEEWREKHMKNFLGMTQNFVAETEKSEPLSRIAAYESFFQQATE